jgi:uncharacterized protein YjiK
MFNLNAKTIANIPEASGIAYVEKSNTLFVANDEGSIYELSKKGKILRKKHLGKYDLEGITYNSQNDTLLLAVEGKESILVLDRKSLELEKTVKIKRKFDGISILKKSKKTGIEAIAIDTNGDIYVSNQSKITYKKKLKENASVILRINSLNKKKAKIKEVFNHGYIDIAGLTFHDGYLYMTSDKKNLLIKYDIQNNTTVKKIKLPKSAQEGICFDNNGYVYIADDKGRVLRYKKDKLGI